MLGWVFGWGAMFGEGGADLSDSAATTDRSRQSRRSGATLDVQPIRRERTHSRIAPRATLATTPSENWLELVMEKFYLSNGTLRRFMAHLARDMDKGLEQGAAGSNVSMLLSFVPELPDGSEHGRYLSMDLGGTNLRCMLMEMRPGHKPKTQQRNTRIPNYAMTGTATQLFDFIADALATFLEDRDLCDEDLPLGFTFSFPCEQTGIDCAKLISWTKGFKATGVEGKDVVQLLKHAIQRRGGIQVRVVALVNDTVGTQVAAAYEHGGCDAGVIIATGTNAAYIERADRIPKLTRTASKPYKHPRMIINTEWGGFGGHGEGGYILTEYDAAVDAKSVHPDHYIFDKLIAGMYMGEVVRLILVELASRSVIFTGCEISELLMTPGWFPTKYISELLSDESGTYTMTRQIMDELGIDSYTLSDVLIVKEVCMVVSRRSANLAAAAIACCAKRVGKDHVTVGVDGSTFRYHPFYNIWVRDKTKELLDGACEFTIVPANDGSGKGAALIAAIIDRVTKRELGIASPPVSASQSTQQLDQSGVDLDAGAAGAVAAQIDAAAVTEE